MKIGDVVIQESELIKLKGKLPSESLGIVVDIHDWKNNEGDYPDDVSDFQKSWLEKLGRRVDVLWSNGNVTKSFAESSLKVVSKS